MSLYKISVLSCLFAILLGSPGRAQTQETAASTPEQPGQASHSPVTGAESEGSLSLGAAIDEAIARAPGFGVIDAEIDAARGEAQTALVRPNPELSFGPGWKHVREGDDSHNEFKGSLSLSQVILFPGKRELLASIGQKNIALKRAGIEGLRFQIAAAVRKSFYELLSAESILHLREQQLESAKVFHQATSKRVAEGYASDFEAIKSRGELVNAERLLRAAEGRIAAARIELNTLLGRPLTQTLAISGRLEGVSTEPETGALVAYAIGHNPSLRVQAMQAELAGLNLRRARLSKKPDISVGPTLEYSRSEQILGFGATIALPRKNSNAGEIQSASAEQRRVLAETDVLRREVSSAIVHAASKLATAKAQLALYTPDYLAQLKAVVVQAEQSYAQSVTSLLVYLEAKQSYYDTLASYFEALGDVAISRAELEASVGTALESIPSNSAK
jgi:cobalt-zinc-cadmium efflux system outer membrane protein